MHLSLVGAQILLFASMCSGTRIDPPASPVPPDFEATIQGGSAAPWGEISFVRVDSAGACTCVVRDRAAPPMTPARIDTQFVVAKPDLDSLWAAVTGSGFFELAPDWRDEGMRDGTFQSIEVQAEGRLHRVDVLNVHVEALDGLLDAVDRVIPDGCAIPRIAS